MRILKNIKQMLKSKNIKHKFEILFLAFKDFGLKDGFKAIINRINGKPMIDGIGILNEKQYVKFLNHKYYEQQLNKYIKKSKIHSDLKKRLIIDKNKVNIFYIYEGLGGFKPTFRYRVFNMYEGSLVSAKCNISFVYLDEIKFLIPLLFEIKIIIFSRCYYQNKFSYMLKAMKEKGVKIGFDIDDLLFNPNKLSILLKTIDEGENNKSIWSNTINRYNYLAKHCDFGLATNNFLAEEMHKNFKFPVYVFPNTINIEQLTVANDLLTTKKTADNKFKIIYCSGSQSHNKDFKLVEESILKILIEYKNVYLIIVGYLDLNKEKFDRFIKIGRIVFKPYCSYLDLLKVIYNSDLNIAPLVINEITNSKSELKFFESALVKIPTIASPTYSYKLCIKDGWNGYLAYSNDDWYNKIKKVIKNNNYDLKKNAYNSALSNYYILNKVELIDKIFDSVINNTNHNIYRFYNSFDKISIECNAPKVNINIKLHC